MTSPGIVYVDEIPYPNLRLPKNWTMHHNPKWGSLQASMQYVFTHYPNASSYGWLADDTVPRTEGWDRELELSAGPFGFSHARDLWWSEDPIHEYEYLRGDDMSAGLCWGGDLVRTVGWWALPGVMQAGIDTAWTAMIGPLGLCRYRQDVVVEHKHYKTGKRATDQGDSWVRDGVNYVQADIDTRDRWVASQDFIDTVERCARAAHALPNRTYLTSVLVDAKVSQWWKPGMPAVRMANLVREFEVEVDELVANVLRVNAHPQPSGPPRERYAVS